MELKKKKLERHEPHWNGEPSEFIEKIERNKGGDIPAGWHYLSSNDTQREVGDSTFLICRLSADLEKWIDDILGKEFYLKLIRRNRSIALYADAEKIVGARCIAEWPANTTLSRTPLASIEEIGFEFPS